jgi:peptidoglycan/xylan/chitin deacetylase (PgdA/CDA1 family)
MEHKKLAMTVDIPILMYHSVTENPPPATRKLSVRPTELDRQLRHLRENGFTGLTFTELCRRIQGRELLPPRSVVITFDDGYADMHAHALPLLMEHGFPATVFVTTGWLRDAGRHAAGRPLDRMLSWSQVRELAASGIEIGAHSHGHPQLDQLRLQALRAELRVSKALLEDGIGHPVPSLAYPFGYSCGRVRDEVASAGYQQAAGVGNAAARADGGDRFAVPRMTVGRSTSMTTFAKLADRRQLGWVYATDRALTRGWWCVRRARSVMSRIGQRA